MRNPVLIFFISIFFLLFSSCKSSPFEITNSKFGILTGNEILKLDITNKYISHHHIWYMKSEPTFQEDSKIIIPESGPDFIEFSEEVLEELYEKFSPENEKKLKKEFIKNLHGINSYIEIRNNTNEIIENGRLTIIIIYKFKNKTYYYLKPYKLLREHNIWEPNTLLKIKLNEIISFSVGDSKVLNIHKPEKVEINLYVSAQNSVGYNNVNANANGPKIDNYFRGKEPTFGLFTDVPLESNVILSLGNKILSKEITKIWNKESTGDKLETPNKSDLSNGDLDTTFKEKPFSNENRELINNNKKDSLIAAGWTEENIQNGEIPSCYNFKPTKSKIKNYLDVNVGSGTDVVIKMMDVKTDKCIRYVFINNKSNFKIQNIPEGKYYLKLAYGKNWFSKIKNGQCIGKFIKDPVYERSTEILNFIIRRNNKTINIPSYDLSLDVISTEISNSFNSENISELEFNQ